MYKLNKTKRQCRVSADYKGWPVNYLNVQEKVFYAMIWFSYLKTIITDCNRKTVDSNWLLTESWICGASTLHHRSVKQKAGDSTNTLFTNVLKHNSMQSLRNKVSLIGRLGQQPEITTLPTGTQLAKMPIAINERYKNKSGEWVDDTQWHQIIVWNSRLIDRVGRQLGKGTEVMIEGRIVNRSFETKTGEKRYSTEIEMSNFLVIGSKQQTN
jgi:single-strand DNA-binding protein